MAIFSPPTRDDVPTISYDPGLDPLGVKLMRHFNPGTRGRNVIKESDIYSTVDEIPQSRIDAAVAAQNAINPDVRAYYHGGHSHSINATEEAELTAAGYGDQIT